MDIIHDYLEYMAENSIVILIVTMIVFDTVLGCIRALRQKGLNSSFGIDGGIRKASMVASIAFLGLIDQLLKINFVGFIPQEYLDIIKVSHVGCMEFFGVLYIVYEALSILKNMYCIGIPMPSWLQSFLGRLLTDLTKEIKSDDDDDGTDPVSKIIKVEAEE